MKKVLGLFLLINLGIATWLGSMFFMAETGPFHPWDVLFSLQENAEHWRVNLTGQELKRTELTFKYVERRLSDLAMAVSPKQINKTALAFDKVLSDAILRIETVKPADKELLYKRLEVILVQADVVLSSLNDYGDSQVLVDLSKKITYLHEAASPQDVQAVVKVQKIGPAKVVAKIISFLGNEVAHEAFPLKEGHAEIDCLSCHRTGEYVTTPTTCSACHELKADKYDMAGIYPGYPFAMPAYPDHFSGECSDCHGIKDWLPISFNHLEVYECLSCHSNDLPEVVEMDDRPQFIGMRLLADSKEKKKVNPNHYPGDCELCHTSTITWGEYSFEHQAVTECESCHAYQTPEEHFEGACTNCHNDYKDWLMVEVNHEVYPDCVSCHLDEKPVMHYKGTCSNCHKTDDWSDNYFNHYGYNDCTDCHLRPMAHYPGQCDDCHVTTGWTDTVFDHGGTKNCSSCHNPPAGHYPGECVLCHNTRSWSNSFFDHFEVANCLNCHATETPEDHFTNSCLVCHTVADWNELIFEHIDSTDCLSCHKMSGDHYVGQCSNCHVIAEWALVDFNHTGFTECIDCHTVPENHYIGLCLNCHDVESWEVKVMDHTGLTECLDCHEAPPNHYPGICSDCHGFTNWTEIIFTHKDADNCTGCHKAPTGHWPGQCSKCHNVSDWSQVVFDHTGYTNCSGCHPRPVGHPRGQCSRCHTTKSWEDASSQIPADTEEVIIKVLPIITDPSIIIIKPPVVVPVDETPEPTEDVEEEDDVIVIVPPTEVVEPTPTPTGGSLPPVFIVPAPTAVP